MKQRRKKTVMTQQNQLTTEALNKLETAIFQALIYSSPADLGEIPAATDRANELLMQWVKENNIQEL